MSTKYYSPAEGAYSHAEGACSYAEGAYSHAEGCYNKANTEISLNTESITNAIKPIADAANKMGVTIKEFTDNVNRYVSLGLDPDYALEAAGLNYTGTDPIYLIPNTCATPVKLAESEPKKTQSTSRKMNAHIVFAYDTEENWETSDRILMRGEIALVEDRFGRVWAKVGNGKDKVLDCPTLSGY